MKLALVVPTRYAETTSAWFLICVRDEEPPGNKLATRIGRVVTLESAREDYGVKVPPRGSSHDHSPVRHLPRAAGSRRCV
jgi:hypothetical protein